MKVLGISGMHRSMDYKASLLGHVDPRFYRICQGMDSAAALIVDGKVIAAVEEERLDRKKHSNRLPVKAIQFCLNEAGYQLEDMDLFVHSINFNNSISILYSLLTFHMGFDFNAVNH